MNTPLDNNNIAKVAFSGLFGFVVASALQLLNVTAQENSKAELVIDDEQITYLAKLDPGLLINLSSLQEHTMGICNPQVINLIKKCDILLFDKHSIQSGAIKATLYDEMDYTKKMDSIGRCLRDIKLRCKDQQEADDFVDTVSLCKQIKKKCKAHTASIFMLNGRHS